MNQILLGLGIGALISTILAMVSVRGRSLTLGGGVGAILIGTVIFAYVGWAGYVVLLSFFVSSSLLTRFRFGTKAAKGVSELKAGARTIWQTIGQGGVALIICGMGLLIPNRLDTLAASFVAALAEANADTWAVELGVLSKKNPRLMTKLSTDVPPGTSGGISTLGELSALAGCFFLAIVAGVLGILGSAPVILVAATAIAALVGEHVDSVLGATVQAAYYCPVCQKETERRVHRCGTLANHVKGFRVMTNEAVNFVSTATAAVLALILCLVLW